ncbi:MAG: hypothetical protein U0836_06225 [Pirellulales bacterium]
MSAKGPRLVGWGEQSEPHQVQPSSAVRWVGLAEPRLTLQFAALPVLLFALAPLALAQNSEPPTSLQTAPPLASPQELWQAWGLDFAGLKNLPAQGDLSAEQLAALLPALGQVARVPLEQAEGWARGRAGEGGALGDFEPLRGRIVGFEELPLPPELGERFENERVYRGELERADGSRAVVFANRAPRRWQAGHAIDEAAGCLGVVAAPAGGAAPTSLLADRLAFYPAGPLGDLGMDAGLFDDVEDRRGLVGDEREAFYQLLAAVGRANLQELNAAAEQKISVAPLFNKPAEQRGRLVMLEGRARRAVEVKVPDRDILARFGIHEYWELELVTPDSQRNPLVVVVRSLPPGMPTGSDINVPLRVAGFFFKSWAYHGAGEGEAARGARRLAPLLVGLQPELIERSTPAAGNATAVGGSIALGVVGLMFIWALWRLWGDQRRKRPATSPASDQAVRESLRELGE